MGALSSVGDFLQTVAFSAVIRTKAAEGVGAGATKLNPVFGGGIIPAVKELSKVNGRVDESMQKKGVLTVGKKSGASGQFVYVSGHALGLSSQVSAFTGLGSRLAAYLGYLSKLTSKLPKTSIKKPMNVPPPE